MAKTYTEQLESVQAAIAAIESGAQSYRDSSGNQLNRGDLDVLYRREAKLRPLAAREARGGGIRVRGVIPIYSR